MLHSKMDNILEDLQEIRSQMRDLIATKRDLMDRLDADPSNKALRSKLDDIQFKIRSANEQWKEEAIVQDPNPSREDIKQLFLAHAAKASAGELRGSDLKIWEKLKTKLPNGVVDKIISMLRDAATATMQEDQYKYPNRKHIRKQSLFRSSFNKSRSFGGRS
ncbi:MAG: hypothetical protein GF411_14240 [Candidatus Lokiarchaeota archaeon]|nr:hypothetical protein [Candidatus Lokiarchaeota archaeon]